MTGGCELQVGMALDGLVSATGPEQELLCLRDLQSLMATDFCGEDPDQIEQNWLLSSGGSDHLPTQRTPQEVLCTQDNMNVFMSYVYERRYGWTEGGSHLTATPTSHSAQCKAAINAILDEYITWLEESAVSKELLMGYQYSLHKAKDKPVVRKHTVVHVIDWLKEKTEDISEDSFANVLEVLIVGVTDVWSAIRNACVSRLSTLVENFSFLQLEQFFGALVQVCKSEGSSWQAKEGAVMGMNAVVRRFQWIGLVPDSEKPPTVSSSPSSLSTKSPRAEYFLKFGEQELHGMPTFITTQMHDVIFPLLAHEQLSIREHAIKTFSSYLARSEFQEALTAFKDVMKQLSRDIPPTSPGAGMLPQRLTLEAGFRFMDAYEAEGLLGVCVFLVKHIPPGFLLPNWPHHFRTFSVYLMHPASTVRQATSAIFKFLVAKDSHNPTMLKLVLQALSTQWNADVVQHAVTQSNDVSIKQGVVAGRGKIRRISITSAISCQHREDVNLCDTWQWREGRLLAYELICQFLIKNHWLYTFGPPHLWAGMGGAAGLGGESGGGAQDADSSSEQLFPPQQGSQRQGSKIETSPSSSFGGAELRSSGLFRTSSEKHRDTSGRQRVTSGDSNNVTDAASRKHSLKNHGMELAENKSGSESAQLMARLPTVAGFSSPSLRTLVRHYSYYTQPEGRTPFTSPQASTTSVNIISKAASLLMHTLALDIQQQESDRETPSPRYDPKPDGKRRRSVLCPSPIDLDSSGDAASMEDWFVDTELSSMAVLLHTVLHQTVESMADASWELRRMGQQLLPCVVEVIRWYDMKILEELWSSCLVPSTSLMCYGACQALKFSIVHAAKLKPMLQQPPPSWQDANMCRQVVLRITETIRQGLPRFLGVVHSLLHRPVTDKLTVLAAEILMLAHTHFHLPVEQKLVQIKGVVRVITEVFYKAHPDSTLSTTQSCNHKRMEKVFNTPSEGFFSCCNHRPSSAHQAALQVEGYLLSETHTALTAFLQTTVAASVAVAETAPLLPVLCAHMALFAEDDAIHRSVIDSVCILANQCSSYLKTEESRADHVKSHCKMALRELTDVITQQSLELSVVKSALDVCLQLHCATDATSVKLILQAICTRLNSVKDLSAPERRLYVAGVYNGDADILLAQNSHDTDACPEGSSDEEDELDPPTGGLLQESHTLTLSGTGSKRSARLSVASSLDGGAGGGALGEDSAGGADSDGSDWDSWDEEEVSDKPDQSALVFAFSDFVKKIGQQTRMQSTTDGAFSALESEMAKMPSKDYSLLKSLLATS